MSQDTHSSEVLSLSLSLRSGSVPRRWVVISDRETLSGREDVSVTGKPGRRRVLRRQLPLTLLLLLLHFFRVNPTGTLRRPSLIPKGSLSLHTETSRQSASPVDCLLLFNSRQHHQRVITGSFNAPQPHWPPGARTGPLSPRVEHIGSPVARMHACVKILNKRCVAQHVPGAVGAGVAGCSLLSVLSLCVNKF